MKHWVEWFKQWGESLERLRRMEEESGRTPIALQNAPELSAYEIELVRGFTALSSRRTVGFGVVNPIQLSEVVAYVQLLGPPSMPLETFIALLAAMDNRYLELENGNKPPG